MRPASTCTLISYRCWLHKIKIEGKHAQRTQFKPFSGARMNLFCPLCKENILLINSLCTRNERPFRVNEKPQEARAIATTCRSFPKIAFDCNLAKGTFPFCRNCCVNKRHIKLNFTPLAHRRRTKVTLHVWKGARERERERGTSCDASLICSRTRCLRSALVWLHNNLI